MANGLGPGQRWVRLGAGGIGSVRHGRRFWQLLTEAAPVSTTLPPVTKTLLRKPSTHLKFEAH